MRVVLIRPALPIQSGSLGHINLPPMGLMALAAFVRGNHEVRVIDAPLEGPRSRGPIVGGIYDRLGLSPAAIAARITDWDAHVAGITCEFSQQIPEIEEIARQIRSRSPRTRIVLGGGFPTVHAEALVRRDAADCVVLGEGEIALANLLRCYEHGWSVKDVCGIVFRGADGEPYRTPNADLIPDLDVLPAPARDLFDIEGYFRAGLHLTLGARRRTLTMMTSRGCPYRCTFCYSATHWRNRFRVQSPRRTIEEMREAVARYRVQEIHFIDDSLLVGRSEAEQVMAGIPSAMPRPRWALPLGINVALLDEPLARLMAGTGCWEVVLAVESASQEVLDRAGKPLRSSEVGDKARLLKRLGIVVDTFLMIGFPGETAQSIRATIDLARTLPSRLNTVQCLCPLPGTAIYREFAAIPGFDPDSYYLWHDCFRPCYSVCELDARQLTKVMHRAHRRDMLRLLMHPRYFADLLRRMLQHFGWNIRAHRYRRSGSRLLFRRFSQ